MRFSFVPQLPSRAGLFRPIARRTFRSTVVCISSPPVSASVPVSVGKRMRSSQIRDEFLAFYEAKQHTKIASASLIPKDPSILLTIAGMVPFKSIFMGHDKPPNPPRATTSQKCIRTNDIENVGITKRHHTFFEMLGNFSFGDYFKKEAIEWAWELLTRVYEIPKERLVVSIFEEDEESATIWRDTVGVRADRIIRMGAADNFWAAGATGPCGPCSEIYFDFDPQSSTPIDLDNDHRFLEVYNLVFMEYSRNSDGNLSPLDNKNIDTGMGLERMAQILQHVDSNYETDLIRPIMDRVADIAQITYEEASDAQKISLKVVGDHTRAVAHLISDGVRPSNIGRGYIVRRLIRRIVRHGRLLGIEGTFIGEILPVVAKLATEANLFEVQAKLSDIEVEVSREENRFLQTLLRGENRLEAIFEAEKSKVIRGADAFELYDTFGFPLELTEEIAQERGMTVDRTGFENCMKEQRDRARAARDVTSASTDMSSALIEAARLSGVTRFNGYTRNALSEAQVAAMVLERTATMCEVAQEGDKVRLLLNETPFYAEGGGQIGDNGMINTTNGSVVVSDTVKQGDAHVHVGEVTSGEVRIGDIANVSVDVQRRRRIQAHHTATHLLQSALQRVVDSRISQAGSLVDADKLRFDFNCAQALTREEIEKVEDVVNNWIEQAHGTVVSHMTLDEAKEAGAIAMFGEKYEPGEVRVVDVPGVSMELCGGTHVSNTAEIGLFKILSESGPSAGIRRIEAVCGAAVLPYLKVRDGVVKELSAALKAQPAELPGRVLSLQDELRAKNKELEAALSKLAVVNAMSTLDSKVMVGKGSYVVAKLDGNVSSEALKMAAGSVSEKLGASSAVILASVTNGKVAFVAVVSSDAQKNAGLSAGKLVGAIAKVCGGGGGGRPNLAQAGGRDPSKLNEALQKANNLLEEAFNS